MHQKEHVGIYFSSFRVTVGDMNNGSSETGAIQTQCKHEVKARERSEEKGIEYSLIHSRNSKKASLLWEAYVLKFAFTV